MCYERFSLVLFFVFFTRPQKTAGLSHNLKASSEVLHLLLKLPARSEGALQVPYDTQSSVLLGAASYN